MYVENVVATTQRFKVLILTLCKVEWSSIMINSFSGKYDFLSNFYTCTVKYDGLTFTNAEAAFQSAKVTNMDSRKQFCNLPPAQAKRLGRKVQLRKDWEDVKDQVMYDVLRAKFSNKKLCLLLLCTGDKELVEGNWWGDTYWGVCRGKGENKLGNMLMQLREELRKEVS